MVLNYTKYGYQIYGNKHLLVNMIDMFMCYIVKFKILFSLIQSTYKRI